MSATAAPFALPGRSTLANDIAVAVRDRIISGELAPGLKIRQQEFSELLGVSRTPLREAFQRLETEGWVDLVAHRGAEVRALTVGEAEEIFTMRVILETAAARISAAAHADEDAPRARELIDPVGPLRDAEPMMEGTEDANQRFHAYIYGLGGGLLPTELKNELERYWTRALRYRIVYWRSKSSLARSHDAHQAIYDAWHARDANATETAVARHILVALADITHLIDRDHSATPALLALAGRYGMKWPLAEEGS
jgi:DNA-binding GntR family transcriptional regulator